MTEAGDKSRRISEIITAGHIVRNDEVVGSIPTSSTNPLNGLATTAAIFCDASLIREP